MDQKPDDKAQPTPAQDKTVATAQEPPKQSPAPVEDEKEINWKKFKEARAQERKQAEEHARRAQEKEAEANALKQAMEALLNKPTRQQVQQDEDPEESEDVRIQRKVDAALTAYQQKMQSEYQQREQQETPRRLEQTYSDFHQVCHESNLDYLDYHYPEISRAFQHMPEGFEKWSSIYKAVKRFVPNTETKKEAAKADNNLKKPQSMSGTGTVTGQSGMSAARLDDARKAENWARMQRALKGLS